MQDLTPEQLHIAYFAGKVKDLATEMQIDECIIVASFKQYPSLISHCIKDSEMDDLKSYIKTYLNKPKYYYHNN